MCVWYYLRLLHGANYLLLRVQTLYKQRPKEYKGVGSVYSFFFFSKTSASAFQRFDSCSAVKQNPFGKLIRPLQTFQFFDATQCEKFNTPLARTGKFTNTSFYLPSSPVSDPGPSAAAGAEGAVDFSFQGLRWRIRGDACVTAPVVYFFYLEFNFLDLVRDMHLALFHLLPSEDTFRGNDSNSRCSIFHLTHINFWLQPLWLCLPFVLLQSGAKRPSVRRKKEHCAFSYDFILPWNAD